MGNSGSSGLVRPNLLFIFTDEHRGSALGCAGNPDVKTPHLDRLAAEGVRLTHACANDAVCTPARGSIITGCWPQTHRALANDLPVDPAAPSLARTLRAAGYRCGYIGKWHLGGWPRDRFVPPGPERMGFDDFWAAWNCAHAYHRARYHLNDSPEPVSIEGDYEPVVQTDLALSFVSTPAPTGSAGSSGAPWCLFLSYGPPHEPYRPLPRGYEDRYDPAALWLPPNCPDTPERRRDLADYYTHVTAVDDQVRRLLDALREQGTLDDTLVVFTSDHGSMLGSHGRQNKHSPWDEATIVPLLLRFGGRLPGGAVDDLLIGHVDLAPTLLGLLELHADPRMEGQDLSAHVRGARDGRPDAVYLQAVICADQAEADGLLEWRGVRTHTATYAEDLRGPWLLYDNAADPFQTNNLIDDPASGALRAAMRERLAGWMRLTRDVLEPKEAALARYELTEAWARRAAHFRAVRGAAAGRRNRPQARGGSA